MRLLDLSALGKRCLFARLLSVGPAQNDPEPAVMTYETLPKERRLVHVIVSPFIIIAIPRHMDALCHVWDEEEMRGGVDPDQVFDHEKAKWGTIATWKKGMFTRGVFDIARCRGEPYVTHNRPVEHDELVDITTPRSMDVRQGDAAVVHCGRTAYGSAKIPYGSGKNYRPRLAASCLLILRETDRSTLVSDMLDDCPCSLDLPWPVHGAIFACGMVVIGNAYLDDPSIAQTSKDRHDFLLTTSPVEVDSCRGSLVNPIAVL